jgi:hypothetical protein
MPCPVLVGLETGQFEVDERVGCGTQVMHVRKVIYGWIIAYQEAGYPVISTCKVASAAVPWID